MEPKCGSIGVALTLALLGFSFAGAVADGAPSRSSPCRYRCPSGLATANATTMTEPTSTTVRFYFKSRATKGFRLSGAGVLTLPDVAADNVLEQALDVKSTSVIHRGVASA